MPAEATLMAARSRGNAAAQRTWYTGPAAGRVLLRLTHRLRRADTLQVLDELAAGPRMTPGQVRADQLARLGRVLRHAEAKVPYYRELFRATRISAADIRTLEDLAALPVLTKDIVRDRLDDLITEGIPTNDLVPGNTGGSTGTPLRFYREASYMAASEAATMRNFRQAGWEPGEMVAYFWGGNERLYRMKPWEFELRQYLRRMYQFDPFRSGPRDMDRWLDVWPRVAATVAFGYASTIARFAAHIESTGVSVPPLRGVFTTAEKLFAQQRDTIARVFRCNVFDCYGTSEVHQIAAECARGRMHVTADFVVLEALEAGRPGATAPLVVTSLRSFAMPFIRYRTEDYGSLGAADCDCGSGFPVVELTVARISDNFVFRDGRVVHGEFFTHLLYGSSGIANFQFHQTAPDSIALRIVPEPGSTRAERQRSVAAAVAQLRALDPGLHIDVAEVAEIPLSASGKHRFTRSDVRIS
jgi:phenylacetate-CoA ligase